MKNARRVTVTTNGLTGYSGEASPNDFAYLQGPPHATLARDSLGPQYRLVARTHGTTLRDIIRAHRGRLRFVTRPSQISDQAAWSRCVDSVNGGSVAGSSGHNGSNSGPVVAAACQHTQRRLHPTRRHYHWELFLGTDGIAQQNIGIVVHSLGTGLAIVLRLL